MYPKARVKGNTAGGGSGESDTVVAASSTSVTATDLATSFDADTANASRGDSPKGASHSSDTRWPLGNEAVRGDQATLPLPFSTSTYQGPLMPPHPFNSMCDEPIADVSPPPPPPPSYGGGGAGYRGGGGAHRRTSVSSHEMKQPLPTPHLYANGYRSDWISNAANDVAASRVTLLDVYRDGESTRGAGVPVGFAPLHCRTDSSTAMTASISTATPSHLTSEIPFGNSEGCPPPTYGEANQPSGSVEEGDSTTHQRFCLAGAKYKSPLCDGVAMRTDPVGIPACRASPIPGATAPAGYVARSSSSSQTPPPPFNIAVASAAQHGGSAQGSSGHGLATEEVDISYHVSHPVNHFASRAPSTSNNNGAPAPASGNAGAAVGNSVSSLKIIVGANRPVTSAPPSHSPLMSFPLPNLAQTQGMQRCGDSANRMRCSWVDSSFSGHLSNSNETNTPPRDVDEMNKVDVDNEHMGCGSGMNYGRSTTTQAEARYQHLYEEFRKINRVRVKLLEDNERLRRENSTMREELDYYRNKVAIEAEEREVLLRDYRDDVARTFSLAQLLAADATKEFEGGSGAVLPRLCQISQDSEASLSAAKAQAVLDAALSRLILSTAPSVTVEAPVSYSSQGPSAPPTPTLRSAATVGLLQADYADKLGLRYGRWMIQSDPKPQTPDAEDESERPDGRETRSAASEAPNACPQCLLLRDEVRDVHRNAHAALRNYMTSLDFGPVHNLELDCCRHRVTATSQEKRQQQFSTQYRGLHLHIDVPHFHADSSELKSESTNHVKEMEDGGTSACTS